MGKTLKQIRQQSVFQWMGDHITITTKVEEILDVDISQISSVLNLVFDADIAGSAASITDTTTIY